MVSHGAAMVDSVVVVNVLSASGQVADAASR
jgi:hypothetical protein